MGGDRDRRNTYTEPYAVPIRCFIDDLLPGPGQAEKGRCGNWAAVNYQYLVSVYYYIHAPKRYYSANQIMRATKNSKNQPSNTQTPHLQSPSIYNKLPFEAEACSSIHPYLKWAAAVVNYSSRMGDQQSITEAQFSEHVSSSKPAPRWEIGNLGSAW